MNPIDSRPLTHYAGGMRRWLILLGMLVAGATAALGQGSSTSPAGVNYVSSAPSGSCVAGSVMQVLTTGAGTVYACQSISAGLGTWTALSSSGSTGTVTGITLNGTANQVSVSSCAITVSGTCTVSLPSAITLPGTINGETIPNLGPHGEEIKDSSFLLLFNSSGDDREFMLPRKQMGAAWTVEVNTVDPDIEPASVRYEAHTPVIVTAHSMQVLKRDA